MMCFLLLRIGQTFITSLIKQKLLVLIYPLVMKYKQRINVAIILTASFLIFGCEKEMVQKDLNAEIEDVFNNSNLPSLSACVLTENGIVWSKHMGYANLEDGIKVYEETIYHIGSISKLFIVTAVMQT